MMAVPFAIPEDEINNLITAVIFILSQTRLEPAEENHHLQECMEELVRLLMEELERRSRSSQYDNQLRRTLFLLRQSLSQFTANPSSIPRRRRSSSKSSCCCDDCKLSVHDVDVTEDCSQVGLGLVLRKIADYDSTAIIKETTTTTTTVLREKEFVEDQQLVDETTLLHFVPEVRRMFWTAVPLICMVGWHLFQTNYCM